MMFRSGLWAGHWRSLMFSCLKKFWVNCARWSAVSCWQNAFPWLPWMSRMLSNKFSWSKETTCGVHSLIALHKSAYAIRPNATPKQHRYCIFKSRLKKLWIVCFGSCSPYSLCSWVISQAKTTLVREYNIFPVVNGPFTVFLYPLKTDSAVFGWKKGFHLLLWLRNLYLCNIFLTIYLVAVLQTSYWQPSSTIAFRVLNLTVLPYDKLSSPPFQWFYLDTHFLLLSQWIHWKETDFKF